ncbi:MAG: ester cyclase [Ferruginibacter sp.]
MQKIYQTGLIITLMIGTFSCSLNHKDEVAENNVKSYKHIWDEIMNKGNIKLFDSGFSPNVMYDNVTTHLKDIDEVKKYFGEYITGFSNRDFKVLEAYGQGDHVIKRWSFTGTHTGNFAGIKATGKRITVEGVTIATMKMGKIIAERDYADDLGMLQKLGVIPVL